MPMVLECGAAGAGHILATRSCVRSASSAASDDNIVKLFDRVLNPREIRRRLGLNQEQFWTQIGVTQSGGSRYESGREMPKPVRELLRLVHVEQIDLSQVKRVDFEIISYLKESHPDLYRNLRRAVRSKHKRPDGEPGSARRRHRRAPAPRPSTTPTELACIALAVSTS